MKRVKILGKFPLFVFLSVGTFEANTESKSLVNVPTYFSDFMNGHNGGF